MSQFNAIGEYGLNDVLTKRLTTPGGSNAPSVAPEIFPVLTLENDRPEWGHLKGELHCSRYVFVGAVAGQYGMAQLYLPTTSRNVGVITKITSVSATELRVGRLVGISGGLGGWTAQTTMNRDTREGANASGIILEITNNVAYPANHGNMAAVIAAPGTIVDGPFIVGPGGSIGIWNLTVNQNLGVNVEWYERPAQPGELA